MYVYAYGRLLENAGLKKNAIGAGAAYGTAKAGIGIAGVGTFRPDLIMKVHSLYIFWKFK